MAKAEEYTYSVVFDSEDQIYVASVAEFSLEAAHGESPGEALEQALIVIEESLELLVERGESAPEPYSTQSYSGKVLLRMASSLHRALVTEAKDEGISLNHLINTKLSASLRRLTQPWEVG